MFAALSLLPGSFSLTLLIGLAVVVTSGGSLFSRSLRAGRSVANDCGQATVRTFDLLAFHIIRSDGTISRFGNRLQRWEVEHAADRSARAIADALFEAVDHFGVGRPQDDDRTLVVIKGAAA